MIGKPEWFKRRKYGGWGLTPATKEGWIYMVAIIAILFVLVSVFSWSEEAVITATIVWLLILSVDIFHIMATIEKDEREARHEAISERNALWGVMLVLIVGVLYYALQSAFAEELIMNWWLIAALSVAVIVKSISNYYLEKKD